MKLTLFPFLRIIIIYFICLLGWRYFKIQPSSILVLLILIYTLSLFKFFRFSIYFLLLIIFYLRLFFTGDDKDWSKSDHLLIKIQNKLIENDSLKVYEAEIMGYKNRDSWKIGSQKIRIYSYSNQKLIDGAIFQSSAKLMKDNFLFLYSPQKVLIHDSPVFRLKDYLKPFKERSMGLLDSISNKDDRAVLKTIIFSERAELSAEIKSQYANLGASHFLSVSGLHIGILFSFLMHAFGFMRKKGLLFRWMFFILILIIFLFYSNLAGNGAPILRASLMFSFILFGQLFFQPYTTWNILFFCGFLLLWFSPDLISDLGFILSFLAVSGILLLNSISSSKTNEKKGWISASIQFIKEISLVGFLAQLFTFPFIIYYFHQLPNLGLYFLFNPIIAVFSSLILLTNYLYLLVGQLIYLSFLKTLLAHEIHVLHFLFKAMNSIFGTGMNRIFLYNWEILFYYVFIVLLFHWILKRKFIYLKIFKILFILIIFLGFILRFQMIHKKRPMSFYQTYRSSIISLKVYHRFGIIRIHGNDFPSKKWLDRNFKETLSYYSIKDTLIQVH